MRARNTYRRAIQVVEGFVGDDRDDLRAPTKNTGIFLDREDPMRPRYRPKYGLGIERHERTHVHHLATDACVARKLLGSSQCTPNAVKIGAV